jgi:hypothetical protein
VLVITVAAMVAILVIAAFAIDTAIWFVHGRHLQTEADAAALAGAQLFQFPCSGTTDNSIANVAHQYDGTTAPPTGTGFNQQVNREPTPATMWSPAHNLFSLLNYPQFENQNTPNPGDALTRNSPCSDSAVDVKMTETNLPSFLTLIHPSYINKEAEVAIENLTSTTGLEPLAEPLPTPNSMQAYLIDEGNGDNVVGTVTLNPVPKTSNAQWTATTNFAFNATGPIGMEIATSTATTITGACASAPNCYDSTDSPNIGVTYTHLWSTGTATYPATPPLVNDATVAPTLSGGCPGAPSSAFSNFISTSISCTVNLTANLQFGTGVQCQNAGSFTITYGTRTATMSPPATCSSGTASPNGNWTSSAITVDPSTGPIPLTLNWSSTIGTKPVWAAGGDKAGLCSSNNKPCTYIFPGNIQRLFSGGYNDESLATSNSGPILAASIDNSSGAAIQSIQTSTTATTITLNVTVESFQNSQSISPPSPSIELAFGGNQKNALVGCPGQSAGKNQAETAIFLGCNIPVELNTNFPPATVCNSGRSATTDPATGAYICLTEVPGGGKLDAVLDDAMQCKINESSSTTACNPVNGVCIHPNYWVGPNTVNQLENEVPPDPRLLTLFTTDNGALTNGSGQVPIRIITDFYVTGWLGDPCIGQLNGTSQVLMKDGTTATLTHTADVAPNANDADQSGILLGHFVQFTVIGPGSGSGKCVQQSALGNCIGILTK